MTRILIVEDNELNRELVQDILDGNGIDWVSAENGREAIRLMQDHVVDLILMDLQMPGLDGFQTLAEIKKLLGTNTPPTIAITGNAMEIDRKRCLENGFSEFLKKPFRVLALLQLIEQTLEKKRPEPT